MILVHTSFTIRQSSSAIVEFFSTRFHIHLTFIKLHTITTRIIMILIMIHTIKFRILHLPLATAKGL